MRVLRLSGCCDAEGRAIVVEAAFWVATAMSVLVASSRRWVPDDDRPSGIL